MVAADMGKDHLVPAPANRKARVAEIAPRPRLGEADEGDGAGRVVPHLADHAKKLLKARAGGVEDLGNRLGRGPAQPAIAGGALGFVEGGRIKPRLAREAGSGCAVGGGERIDGAPNLFMGKHGSPPRDAVPILGTFILFFLETQQSCLYVNISTVLVKT